MSRQSGGGQSIRDDTRLEASGSSPEVATVEADERAPTATRSSQPDTDATSTGGTGQNTATVKAEERGLTQVWSRRPRERQAERTRS
ncbi:hypothetical protein PF008_g30625 [Phytophthora fragariae]|uniref:Uncharacterized protein n=1 Tax=Phytophthora fragariae TaxID=53985 RepID=A0A6G0Q512_9STRA|nr:hypothetical protein PF008_g30625 [Phytophthora fragariae]